MPWFLIAMGAPLCWCLSNIMDQLLVQKYFSGSVRAVFVYAGVVAPPFALALGLYDHTVLDVTAQQALLLCCCGLIYMAMLYPYLLALREDDASRATPVFQTQSFIVMLLGWAILGETLPLDKVAAGLLIGIGCMALSWNFGRKANRLRAFWLMLLASCIASIYTIILRAWATEVPYRTITFWASVGWTACGLTVMAVDPASRREFLSVLKRHPLPVVAFGALQEVMDALGLMAFTAALAIAPSAAHVQLIGSLQIVFITLASGLCALVWKEHFERLVFGPQLLYRVACMTVIIGGLYWLLLI